MKQRKRPGGSGGLGYFTSWEKTKGNGCIYCGKPATTREHTPSKTFLRKPYPNNLPTIPACFECNNSYSEDEKYVSCFLDVLKSYVYSNYTRESQTDNRLSKDKTLKATLEKQIHSREEKIIFQPDGQRISRILIKLARGHAGYELDYVYFDDTVHSFWCNFVFNMTKDETNEFNSIPTYNFSSEVGSRGMPLFQNLDTGYAQTIARWIDVQDGQYRYQVFYDSNENIGVKIVIYEFLYCKVIFQ